MAKEKKRGFFSWLGFGQKEQAQETETEQKVEEQQAVAEEIAAVETPAEPSAPKADPAAFAEDVVEVTETVVESEKAHLAEPASAQEEEWVETPALTEETPVVEPEPAVSEPPEQPAVVEPLAEEVIAEPVVAEAVAEQPVEGIVVQPQETEAPEEDAPLSDEELEAQALAAEAAEEAAVVVPAPEDEAPLEALAQEQEKPTKEGFFARLKRSLLKTKQNLGSGFISLFRGKKIDDDLFEELEEQLLIADVGVETTRKIITNLTEGASRKQLRDAEALYGLLKEEMGEILAKVDEPLNVEGKTPFVILMVGVNGVGKTTTIGKLARQFEQQGKSVMLAAGWFCTGDLGYLDDEGWLYIKDRSKDMINRGGEKIYSLELENILSTYRGVREVAVIPTPSPVYGEEPVAFIVPDGQHHLTSEEILDWLKVKIARFKLPARIIFTRALPRTHNGKVSKQQLKTRLAESIITLSTEDKK